MSCCQYHGIQKVFDDKVARHDLKRYRKKGPSRTTRILLDALKSEGVDDATLLDIGGGVGAVTNGLLDAGASHATVVDASPAYLAAAQREAERQGHLDLITYHAGDFIEVAPEISAADVVTLDRVICCYDDVELLVGASADRAEKLYGVVYPREVWWNRAGIAVMNFACLVRRSPFRAYIHSAVAVDRVVKSRGLERRFRRVTFLWQVVVYGR